MAKYSVLSSVLFEVTGEAFLTIRVGDCVNHLEWFMNVSVLDLCEGGKGRSTKRASRLKWYEKIRWKSWRLKVEGWKSGEWWVIFWWQILLVDWCWESGPNCCLRFTLPNESYYKIIWCIVLSQRDNPPTWIRSIRSWRWICLRVSASSDWARLSDLISDNLPERSKLTTTMILRLFKWRWKEEMRAFVVRSKKVDCLEMERIVVLCHLCFMCQLLFRQGWTRTVRKSANGLPSPAEHKMPQSWDYGRKCCRAQ